MCTTSRRRRTCSTRCARSSGERLVLVPFCEPFNYSRKMNLGVLHSTGDRLVLMNDDVAARADKWLEELVAPLDEVDVGMTGAKLTFSNDTIQHIGHCLLRRALPAHRPSPSRHPRSASSVRWGSVARSAASRQRVPASDETPLTRSAASARRCRSTSTMWTSVTRCGARTSASSWCHTANCFHFESRTRERIVDDWERIAVQRPLGRPAHRFLRPPPQAVRTGAAVGAATSHSPHRQDRDPHGHRMSRFAHIGTSRPLGVDDAPPKPC